MSWKSALGKEFTDFWGEMFGTGEAEKALAEGTKEAKGDITSAYQKAEGYAQPIYNQGMQAYRTLGDLINSGAFQTEVPTYQAGQEPDYGTFDFDFQADPGYQFILEEGSNAINRNAAARGNMLSGSTLKALQKYGSGLASQEYGNAYNRAYNKFTQNRDFLRNKYTTDRAFDYNALVGKYNMQNQQNQNRYGQYANMANTGLAAATTLGDLSTGYGENMGNLSIGQANANAAAIINKQNREAQLLGDVIEGGTQLIPFIPV